MTLASGTRLGPYEIQSAIGEGGMGEVYKARDTRLDRSVAIKVLPPAFSADPDRRARFEREAKTIAGLSHPHICTLHDVGEHDGATYLVMEHLQGQTLADRLTKGPLPLEQALTVATEIADALSAAHRQGVVHRDLKPGNVMLTKTGAKVLDFGLAKLAGHGDRPATDGLTAAPTEMRPLTGEGAIVGTLQYMAPEQVEGKPADARTDLWALGAILYEMLTGKPAFAGTSAASLIGNIMNSQPPALTTIQPLTPPGLDRLVRRCLCKVTDDRWASAHDVADELRWMRETISSGAAAVGRPPRGWRLRTAATITAGLGFLIIGVGLWWLLRPAEARLASALVSLDVSPAEGLNSGGLTERTLPTPGGASTALAWTPDGEALVFIGRRAGGSQLYVRPLNASEARPLKGTEGARALAVSPNGVSVAFWAGDSIKRVPLVGGPVDVLAANIRWTPNGMAWDERGSLFFSDRSAGRCIRQIPPEGRPTAVTRLREGENEHAHPWLLPGGRALLYTVRKRDWTWGDEQVVVETLATGERKSLLTDASDARYVPTGHLVFLRRGQLFAVQFDTKNLNTTGREVPVLDNVAQALTAGSTPDITGAGQFTVAPRTGALAWVPSGVVPYPNAALVTVSRSGVVTPLATPQSSYGYLLRVSPDGRRLAVTVRDLTEVGLWICDIDHPGILTPLVRKGEVSYFIFSPDGRNIVFTWQVDGRTMLASVPADATTEPQRIALSDDAQNPVEGVPAAFPEPACFAPDGRQFAAVQQFLGPRGPDVVMVTVEGGKASARPLVGTPDDEQWPDLSRDGRWLAYASSRSKRMEVYVRPEPGPGPAPPQVSIYGGSNVAWNPNGRELFFVTRLEPSGPWWMVATDFAPGAPQPFGSPRPLFKLEALNFSWTCSPQRCYDVAPPNGQQFYAVQVAWPPASSAVTHVSLFLNWLEELKAKVPVKR